MKRKVEELMRFGSLNFHTRAFLTMQGDKKCEFNLSKYSWIASLASLSGEIFNFYTKNSTDELKPYLNPNKIFFFRNLLFRIQY